MICVSEFHIDVFGKKKQDNEKLQKMNETIKHCNSDEDLRLIETLSFSPCSGLMSLSNIQSYKSISQSIFYFCLTFAA